jgi:predicted nuclease of predicted toxin-antitoxin system
VLRYHLDEHLPSEIANGLRRRQIECSTTNEAGLVAASDDEQLNYATREQRVLVTHDRDFVRVHARRPDHFGIVLLTGNRHFGAVIKDLEVFAGISAIDDMRGVLMYLD